MVQAWDDVVAGLEYMRCRYINNACICLRLIVDVLVCNCIVCVIFPCLKRHGPIEA